MSAAEKQIAAGATPMGGVDVGGLRVLVADDHAANRELSRAFLSGMGSVVDEAVDGSEAVEKLRVRRL